MQRPDSILNSTGTCDVMLGVLDAPLLSDAAYEEAIPVYPHPLPGKYQVMDSILFGAGALDWYLDRFGTGFSAAAQRTGANVYDLLLESAAHAPARAGGLFWLPNARGVPTDAAARGAFVGIRDSHTGGDFVRALVEGICYEIRLRIDTFERLFDTSVERMVVVGGTSRSAFWTQLRADVTGRAVEVLDTVEAASLGAALLAGMAAGVYADYADAAAQAHRVRRVFEPDRDRHEQYDRCYRQVYRHIAGALHGVDGAIAAIFPPQE